MSKTRHYVVEHQDGQEWLVEANSPGQALRQHVEPLYSVRIAKVPDVVRLLSTASGRNPSAVIVDDTAWLLSVAGEQS